MRLFVIWSLEHDAWWRPGEYGYTRVLAEAGVFPELRAREIVRDANIVHVHECMIPVECVDQHASVRELEREVARLQPLLRRYLDNHCANADNEGVSTLCECKLCLDTRAAVAG